MKTASGLCGAIASSWRAKLVSPGRYVSRPTTSPPSGTAAAAKFWLIAVPAGFSGARMASRFQPRSRVAARARARTCESSGTESVYTPDPIFPS